MSEIIKPPAAWSPQLTQNTNDLQNALGNQRLISIKSYIRNNQRVYAGIAAQDGIAGLGWTANKTYADLKQTVTLANGRLVALDAFWDTGANELRCAGAWIANTQGWKWNFNVDMTPSSIAGVLEEQKGKLTCLRVYTRPTSPDQKPPISFEERYCAIWIQDDGHPWNWNPDIDPSALGLKLEDEDGRLISIDSHAPNSGNVAAIWWKNDTGAVWFWNIGLDATALTKEFPKFCSYGLDVVPAGVGPFASIMCQFPQKPDPKAASLIAFTGSATSKLRTDLGENVAWTLQHQNLTASAVTYKNAVMFAAADGGWCWWSANFLNPSGQTILGLPLSIAASATNSSNWTWGPVTNNPKFGLFCLTAEDSGGKHQNLLAQAPLTVAGSPPPAGLPIKWPVFVGLTTPVESVKLTNGKTWVTVAGQICNGTNIGMTVTNASVRLRDQSKVLHQAYFTDTLTIDQDNTGKFLTTPTVGPVNGSTAPLPKFYDGFEVPASFSSGKLKVAVNVKLNSNCYGDTRDLTVVPAPITVLPHLPYGNAPTSGGPLPLRWHWGNGIGGTGFNPHSTPEHRYCYDINLWDATNSTSKPNSDPNTNSSFYCWGLPILAMDQGIVLFVDDSNEENDGKKQNKITNPANMVVLFNKDKKLYYQYVHLKKGGAVDKTNKKIKVGDTFHPGDQIGLMGNAGDSSEPHLHVGIYNLDAQGFLRSLPMTFDKIKDGSGNVVSGVPVDNDFYAS